LHQCLIRSVPHRSLPARTPRHLLPALYHPTGSPAPQLCHRTTPFKQVAAPVLLLQSESHHLPLPLPHRGRWTRTHHCM
ncbi:hypothetical protein FKM82_031220, partial [Ascaphus truei]